MKGKESTKDASLLLKLKADSGYSSTTNTRVNPQQWGAICKITDNLGYEDPVVLTRDEYNELTSNKT